MQQLREHYERQDSEELLEIARKDLTDEARVILRDVLSKRGVPLDPTSDRQEALRVVSASPMTVDASLASLWDRFVAFAIDFWGVAIALYILFLPLQIFSGNVHLVVFGVVWLGYFLLRDSIPGQSVGKRFLDIRVVQVESGMSCTWLKSLWRNYSHVVFAFDLIFLLGHRRMRLGDMIAGTMVVRA